MFGRIVRNLVGNALKYGSAERPCRVEITGTAGLQSLTLAVEDNGIGMDPRAVRRAFEPFFRASTDRPGHGLGLAIVDRYVRALGGSITLTSRLGVGTRIEVRLPRTAALPDVESVANIVSVLKPGRCAVRKRPERRLGSGHPLCYQRGRSMRVVVAMSGGVDSSAAAALLKEQGHEVHRASPCASGPTRARRSAAAAAARTTSMTRARWRDASGSRSTSPTPRSSSRTGWCSPSCSRTSTARRPIPCVACNQDVKFDFLLQRARALGARLATGHYARVEQERRPAPAAPRARIAPKDQSYFLFTLGQEELARLVFPVGGLTKAEVRAVAERHRLPTSQKPESMEILLRPRRRLRRVRGAGRRPAAGGRAWWTSAARCSRSTAACTASPWDSGAGLGVASGEPLYVQRIDSAAGAVVVGPASGLERSEFTVLQPSWVQGTPPPDEALHVRIRHRHAGTPARVVAADRARLTVRTETPVRAVTPGQAAVFYRGDEVLGGGWIG